MALSVPEGLRRCVEPRFERSHKTRCAEGTCQCVTGAIGFKWVDLGSGLRSQHPRAWGSFGVDPPKGQTRIPKRADLSLRFILAPDHMTRKRHHCIAVEDIK